jgi:OOP family OmpA-OmpF porin
MAQVAPPVRPVETAPAPAPAPEPTPVAPVVTTEKVTFSADALFDFDKAVLKAEGKTKLNELVSKLRDITLEVIVATGYTDSIGDAGYNKKLSLRRAQAVKNYLVNMGVDEKNIYVEGKGEANPVASNKTSAGRAKNRRVEIEVVGKKDVTK